MTRSHTRFGDKVAFANSCVSNGAWLNEGRHWLFDELNLAFVSYRAYHSSQKVKQFIKLIPLMIICNLEGTVLRASLDYLYLHDELENIGCYSCFRSSV